MKKSNNRILILLGLVCVVIAFGCIGFVFYEVMGQHRQKAEEIQAIQEQIVAIDADRTVAEEQAMELARRVGREIEMDRLLEAAQQKYGPEEQERREGDVWIDRSGGKWMITLGALNGIASGTRLRVYDENNKQLGVVVADTVLDVVSYVYPLEDRGQYEEDIYRIVPE